MSNRFPNVEFKKFIKFIESLGWFYSSTVGSHHKYYKKGVLRPLIIPFDKEVSKGTVQSNLKTMKITRNEFIRMYRDFKK